MPENLKNREEYELIDFEIEFRSLVAQLQVAQKEKDRQGWTDTDISVLFFEMAELVADYHQQMIKERDLYTLKPKFVTKELENLEENSEKRLTMSHTLYITVVNILATRIEEMKRNAFFAEREPLTAELGEIVDHTRRKTDELK